MTFRSILVALAAVALTAPARAQQPATPLFAGDMPLRLTLQGPLAAIVRDRQNENARPGMLTLDGQTFPVGLSPRGITRRAPDICDFPPLRVDVRSAPEGSLFAGHRRLKLVTHCKKNEGHQQHVLLEYLAYRIYNLLTPQSFRARLAIIDYRDGDGLSVATRYGFLIEDIYHVGQRNGFTQARTPDVVPASTLSAREAARAAMFQYMIGNLDFSMRAGPDGEGCCHNFRLMQKGSNPALVPVPYDFDFSGFVDAPYATPPAEIEVANVRVRKYRGYCAHNAHALTTAADLRAKRGQIYALITGLPELQPARARKATAYLDQFFSQIQTDDSTRTRVLKGCVG
jgi:hypothetical protein